MAEENGIEHTKPSAWALTDAIIGNVEARAFLWWLA